MFGKKSTNKGLAPRQQAPGLIFKLTDGTKWDLSVQRADNFNMIVFYRGLHCPICKAYLLDLQSQLDEFSELGIDVVAVSCDPQDRAKKSKQEWELDKLNIGYGVSIEDCRNWGLFISNAIREQETQLFCEPGLFLVKADGTLYYAAIQNMPFARPQFSDIAKVMKYMIENDYPARGEVMA